MDACQRLALHWRFSLIVYYHPFVLHTKTREKERKKEGWREREIRLMKSFFTVLTKYDFWLQSWHVTLPETVTPSYILPFKQFWNSTRPKCHIAPKRIAYTCAVYGKRKIFTWLKQDISDNHVVLAFFWQVLLNYCICGRVCHSIWHSTNWTFTN